MEKLLLAVLLAVVVIRTWILPMFSSLWLDEWAVYWIGHQGPSQVESLSHQFIADQRLMSLAGWLGMQVFGSNEFGLRFYSLLSGCFSLVAIHQLCRRWFDQRTALY